MGFAGHGKHHVAHITSLRERLGWQWTSFRAVFERGLQTDSTGEDLMKGVSVSL